MWMREMDKRGGGGLWWGGGGGGWGGGGGGAGGVLVVVVVVVVAALLLRGVCGGFDRRRWGDGAVGVGCLPAGEGGRRSRR